MIKEIIGLFRQKTENLTDHKRKISELKSLSKILNFKEYIMSELLVDKLMFL